MEEYHWTRYYNSRKANNRRINEQSSPLIAFLEIMITEILNLSLLKLMSAILVFSNGQEQLQFNLIDRQFKLI